MAKSKVEIESISVWLIVKDGKNAQKIALQKRSKIDGGKKQAFPFICQSTFNGKLEPKETINEAIAREGKEELGQNFKLPSNLKLFDKSKYIFKGKNGISYNFYAKVLEKDLNLAILHSGAEPEFLFVGKNDLSSIKTTEDKSANPEKEIVLFPDQLNALLKLF